MSESVQITAGSGTPVAAEKDGSGNFVQFMKDLTTEEKLEAIRLLLAGTLTVGDGGGAISVDDNGSSLTVDSPLSAPVGVRLSDGTSGLGTTAGRLQVADGGVALGVKAETLGTEGEAEATANGNVIGLLKRLRKLLEGTGSIGLAAGTNLIGKAAVTKIEEALPGGTNELGKVKVTELPAIALAASTNAIGKLAANGGVNIGNVTLEPRATATGLETKGTIAAAGLNATIVKSAAGILYGYEIFNTSAAARYVKIYNKATAPVVAENTPVIRILVPPGGGVAVESPHGRAFSAGISFVTTTGPADTNAGEVAASDLLVNVYFK